MKVDRNEDRLNGVKAIGTSTQDPEAEVDLCLGSNCKGKEGHVGTNIVHK